MLTLFYVFSNLKNQGFWAPEPRPVKIDAWVNRPKDIGKDERLVTIQIEEVLDEGEMNEIVQKVAIVKEKDSNIGNRSYQEFNDCVRKLPLLFEYYGCEPSVTSSARRQSSPITRNAKRRKSRS